MLYNIAIDDYVMNMLGYESSENGLYAVSRSRMTTLRSTDYGRTWSVLSPVYRLFFADITYELCIEL